MEGFAFLIFQMISQFSQDCAEYVFFFFVLNIKSVSVSSKWGRREGREEERASPHGGKEGRRFHDVLVVPNSAFSYLGLFLVFV